MVKSVIYKKTFENDTRLQFSADKYALKHTFKWFTLILGMGKTSPFYFCVSSAFPHAALHVLHTYLQKQILYTIFHNANLNHCCIYLHNTRFQSWLCFPFKDTSSSLQCRLKLLHISCITKCMPAYTEVNLILLSGECVGCSLRHWQH